MSAPTALENARPSPSTRDFHRIFISGSTAGFGDPRPALCEALARGGCHVIHEADFPQNQANTVLKLAQLIAPCAVLTREIGDRRGDGNALWNSALAHDPLWNRPEAIEVPNAAQERAKLAEWRGGVS